LRDQLIGRDQQAAALVSAGHELEEQMRTAPLERQVPELVDHQQLRLAVEQQPILGVMIWLTQVRRHPENDQCGGFK